MSQSKHTNHRMVEQKWLPDGAALGPLAARSPQTFRAYLPDPIAGAEWQLQSTLAELVAAAERSCRELETHRDEIGLDSVARQLLRAESVASSRIEGFLISNRRLAKASVASKHDINAQSVLGNVAAVTHAYEWAAGDEPFSRESLVEMHRILFARTRDEQLGGRLREKQNWVGGDASSPANADFVPPPWEHVEPLVEDLADFCNRTDLPPILQSAIAHAHFETIHPFMDGNGRAGRALIGMILIRRGVCTRAVPPVSLVLAGSADLYVRGLTSYRHADPNDWFEFFARSVSRAASASTGLAGRIDELRGAWTRHAGDPRAGSAARTLLNLLPSHPVLSLSAAMEVTGASDEACRQALNRLAAADVLRETTAGKRNRVWECVGLFALLDSFERETGDPSRSPAITRGEPSRL